MYTKKVDTDSNYIYIGEAVPGTSTSSSTWRIRRIEFIGDDISITWASNDFDQIWDNHLSLIYI